LKLWNLINAKF